MVQYLGDEGVGLYAMIYPIYVTLILLSTAGFPVAVSKLVSEKNALGNTHGINRIFWLALAFVLGSSVIFALLLSFSAKWIAVTLLADIRTYRLLLAVAPALIFVSIASVIRSYFQGLKNMVPTAISQTFEQMVRIGATFLLIMFFVERGLEYGAAGAALGITCGELGGMLILVVLFLRHRIASSSDLLGPNSLNEPVNSYSRGQAIRDLFNLAVPITVGRLVISLMYTMDAMLIPSGLQQAGLPIAEATSLFGQLSGIALQVIFLPTIISSSLTTSLVPAIADALALKNYQLIRAKYHEVLRITFYIGIPASLFFIFRGNEICLLLFNFADAGPLLAILGVGAVCTYFSHVAAGVLNGLGKPHLSVKNIIIGSAFKLGGLLSLVPHPLFGIKGAAISICAGWIVASVADFISIGRLIGFGMDMNHIILKPVLGCAILYFALPVFETFGGYLGLGNRLVTLFTILVSAIFYFAWMVVVKGVTRDDLQKFS